MSTLTPELALAQAVDNDDTADYLTLPAGLAGSLAILDGMFNATTGHSHNGAHQGATLGPGAFADNTIPGAKLVDGSVTTPKIADGAVTGPKLGTGALEALFASATQVTAVNYTVAADKSFVFCTAAVTVTLPAAATTNRPITVAAVTGQSAANATAGLVYGGSANLTTGAVQNGVVAVGEAFTYKSDGTNWRAV